MNNQYSLVLIFVSLLKKRDQKVIKKLNVLHSSPASRPCMAPASRSVSSRFPAISRSYSPGFPPPLSPSTRNEGSEKYFAKEIKRRLAGMSIDQKKTESARVASKLFTMKEFQESTRFSSYMSMPNEVGTYGIMGKIFELNKRCFIPHYIGPVIKMIELSSMSDYEALPVTS